MNVKKRERMSKVVRQACASHSLTCWLSVSTSGSVLLMSLVELCSFPNKETDKHLVWAAPASVQHEALLPTLCGFPSFLSLTAQTAHVLIVALGTMIIPPAARSGFCLQILIFLYISFKSVCTSVNINCIVVNKSCLDFLIKDYLLR